MVVTNPGGHTVSMHFTVNSTVFSLGGHSVSINAIVTIGNQILPSAINVLATGDSVYQVGMDDQSALPAYPQFHIGFSSVPVSTGSSFSFNSQYLGNQSIPGTYQPGATTAGDSMASAIVTILFSTLAAGDSVSGSFTFGTAQGTVQGNFSGIILSVN